ncbi:MAG TPA: phosphopentomutase, partial [Saliniramus sp.]|nr:phosphopentomutase [Saliniramus sp.]
MPRALLIVLDSVGIGGAPDAARYGDEGANTLGHIAQACAKGLGDRAGLRSGPLMLPNLGRFGIGLAMHGASGQAFPDLCPPGELEGLWGHAVETSQGKDTPSGHWEIAGQPVDFEWGYVPDENPAFPAALTQALIERAGLPGILGNRHASGTQVIEDFGPEHLQTGAPICYTSIDSVLQIAAHEEAFGLERLYETCRIAREL